MPRGIYKRIKGVNYFPEKMGFKKGHKINLGRQRPDMVNHKWNLGRIFTIEHKNKIGEKLKQAYKEGRKSKIPQCAGWNKGLKCPQFSGENHWNWQGGKSFEIYPSIWDNPLKRKIMERDNFACQDCGINRNLVVHHIDEDKQNCEEDNLITLCLNCHAKIHLFHERFVLNIN
jgi:hypothetical protein